MGDLYYSDKRGAYPQSKSDLRRFNQRRSSSWTTWAGKLEDLILRKNAGLPNVGISTYANGKPVEWETYMSKPDYEQAESTNPGLSKRVREEWDSPSSSPSGSPKRTSPSPPKQGDAWGMKSDKIRNSNWVDHKNSI